MTQTRVEMPTITSLQPLIERALTDLGGHAHRTAIRDRVKRIGKFTKEQLAVPTHSLGKRRQYASEIDYRISWALYHCHRDGTVMPGDARAYWRLAAPEADRVQLRRRAVKADNYARVDQQGLV